MFGVLSFFGALTAIVVGTWLLRRRSKSVDEYYERDHQDPPVFDGLGRLRGGKFG